MVRTRELDSSLQEAKAQIGAVMVGRDRESKVKVVADARHPAQAYAARCREDRDAVDVITSIFTINTIPYFALTDIGSTHSYVSCEMANKLGIKVKDTINNVTVLSPLGQSVFVNKVYKQCLLGIQGEVFSAYLMELPFGKLDLILGIN